MKSRGFGNRSRLCGYLICPFVRETHTLKIGGLTVEVRDTPPIPVRKLRSAKDDAPASK